MNPIVLDGKKLANEYNEITRNLLASLDKKPHLACVIVGNDPASETYVKLKEKDCKFCGIKSTIIRLSEDVSYNELVNTINSINECSEYTAILIQLPLPSHLREYTQDIINIIDPKKDVDCFTTTNIGKLYSTGDPLYYPCTPYGICELLETYINMSELEGESAVVIGRSNIVGKPLARMLEYKYNMTVTLCHSKSDKKIVRDIIDRSTIVVSAVGNHAFIYNIYNDDDELPSDKILIDVGINRIGDGKIIGDIPYGWSKKSRAYTPVPGGIGLTTRAMLMVNVAKSLDK